MGKCKCGKNLNKKGFCSDKICIIGINNELKANTSLHEKERRILAKQIQIKRKENPYG